MDPKFRSRKFLLVILVYSGATVMVAMGKMTGTELTGVYMTLVGAYSLANVLEKRNAPGK